MTNPELHSEPERPIPRVIGVRVVRPYVLELEFRDGARQTVDVESLLWGELFEPLRDPERFSEVSLDPILGTIVWSNGADLAPERLRYSTIASLAGAAGKLTNSLPWEDVRNIAREDRIKAT